jgi:hypothetical protein
MRPRLLAAFLVCLAVWPFNFAAAQSGASLGPPKDGLRYTVVIKTQVPKAAPEYCGFNDVGAMNMGIFDRELRQYTEYIGGRPVRTWNETVDVFVRCHQP